MEIHYKMKRKITGISLVSLQSVDRLTSAIASSQYDLHFELSYEMSLELIEEMRPLLGDSVISVHAACPNVEYFPNLASNDEKVIKQSFSDLEMSLETTSSFNANIMVIHPGYATNKAIPSNNKERQELLQSREFQPYIWKEKGSICYPDYVTSKDYIRYCEKAMHNLDLFSRRCADYGITLAVENLNPRVGYLFQTPDEMIHLVENVPGCSICLDVGHLWVSSFLYKFNFLDGVKRILATGKVVTTHLHSNSSHPGKDRDSIRLEDDHTSLYRYNFPYPEVIKEISQSGANMVLEVKEEPVENYTLLMHELIKLHSTKEP